MKKESHFRSRLFFCIFLLFITYMACQWLYKINTLPGLHGDEAWMALKANQFNISGIAELYGMNTYTGILQPAISSLAFKVAGLGILQLRLAGLVLNALGLVILYFTFNGKANKTGVLFFILIFSQSALYLSFPRVAWEVTSFGLFFLSIQLAAFVRIVGSEQRVRPIWTVLFLLANVLGTYNHVLYSCLSVAGLIALILWNLYNGIKSLNNLLFVLFFNAVNSVLVFLTMRYLIIGMDSSKFYIPLAAIIVLLLSEIILLIRLSKITVPISPKLFLGRKAVTIIIFGLGISFLKFHGIAVYEVLGNYKIFTEVYSFNFSVIVRLIFMLAAAIIAAYLIYFIAQDIRNKKTALLAMFIMSYLGILALYTINCSFRYYLSISLFIYLYLAHKISSNIKISKPLIIALAGQFLLIAISSYEIFTNPTRSIRAIEFTIGNRQMETSAHFLPNKPVIEFLKKNKVEKIYYLGDQYFLEQPILFYQLIKPWEQVPGNAAIIDYDYINAKQGGYILQKTGSTINQ